MDKLMVDLPAKTSTSRREKSGMATPKSALLDLLLWVLMLLLFFSIILQPLRINCDSSAFVEVGRLLINGRLPFINIVEINLPLIMYFNIIPALLERLLSVNAILGFLLLVFGVAVWSVFAIRRTVERSGIAFDATALAAFLLVCIALSLQFRVLLDYHFGQREHLFVLLYLPFLVLRWVRWEGGRVSPSMALVTGVAAGLGTCIKPHFGIIALAPELYWLATKREFRRLIAPEAIAFLLACLGYIAHFLILYYPTTLRGFETWYSLVTQTYGPRVVSPSHLLANSHIRMAFVFALAPFVFPAIKQHGLGKLAVPLSVLTFASIFVFVIQQKGYSYQSIPALFGGYSVLVISIIHARYLASRGVFWGVLSLAAIGIVISHVSNTSTRGTSGLAILVSGLLLLVGFLLIRESVFGFAGTAWFQRARRMAPILGIGIGVLGFLGNWDRQRDLSFLDHDSIAQRILTYTREGDAVLFISPYVQQPFPLLAQINRRIGSRYLTTFPLYQYVLRRNKGDVPSSIDRLPTSEAAFINNLSEDIATYKPPVIFVDAKAGTALNTEEYLAGLGFIGTAMRDYAPLADSTGLTAEMQTYVRQEILDKRHSPQGHEALQERG